MKDIGENHDGYHTFNELYEHRYALFLNLLKISKYPTWKSKLHSDGTMYANQFVAGIQLPTGLITYHLPIKYWEYIKNVYELDNAPEWDGHTSQDVVDRLLDNLNYI